MTAGKTERPPLKSIVLVGFMGAGKSRIGRALARRLSFAFIDTDEAIQESYGRTVADIFLKCGEAEFRKAEGELISKLVRSGAKVIALGGGAFIDATNRETLNRHARTIWLDTPFETILLRLANSKTRPLASNRTQDELRSLWEKRREYYAQAHIRMPITNDEEDEIVDRIIVALEGPSWPTSDQVAPTP
ncbi:MAG TPA: shikimate kinase [Sphingomicrobium sp.]|jgi:shikimate kinase|nr:shikimate kinase [Sphingomicrobium sp.]